jgi:phosphorylcholine metabolism protein LicD
VHFDRAAILIVNIKKLNQDFVIGDENTDKKMILEYWADEFTLKPLSPENTADKILILLARDKVADNRSL